MIEAGLAKTQLKQISDVRSPHSGTSHALAKTAGVEVSIPEITDTALDCFLSAGELPSQPVQEEVLHRVG